MACSLKGRCSILVRWNISPNGWPRWTAAAAEGRFEIRREVGYVAGIATYILAGELALGQAVLATGQGRLAAAGQWVLNEKRLTERAGLDAIQDRLAQPGPDLGALVSDVRACLELSDDVWADG